MRETPAPVRAGPIPSEFGMLAALQVLNLTENALTGEYEHISWHTYSSAKQLVRPLVWGGRETFRPADDVHHAINGTVTWRGVEG